MRGKQILHSMIDALAFLFLLATFANAAWAANKEKVLYSFTGGNDGGDPASALVSDSKGNAYGTSVVGGTYGYGTVFELSPKGNKWVETVLWNFSGGSDGKYPYGGVTFDSAGNLYGTTVSGGTGGTCTGDGCGVVYELSASDGSWNLTTLYSFKGGNDGFGPGDAVIFDNNGNLYGTTPDGGKFSDGVVYELTPTKSGAWKQTVLHAFTGGKDGSTGSLGALTFSGGSIYGVAELGGAHGAGTVFQLSPVAGGKWKFSTLYGFKGMPNAGYPYGGLILDASGNLYGTTYYGGKNGVGTVFQLSPGANGKWKERVLHSFNANKDGNSPTTTLVFDASGNLYGTASAGGDADCQCGAVFKLTPTLAKWKENVVHRFTSVPDGAYPYYGLTLDAAGNLYGTTVQGGIHNQGAIFRLTP